jgi:tRNA threonylcarbamoyladenosine biosynthesis protein TsaE
LKNLTPPENSPSEFSPIITENAFTTVNGEETEALGERIGARLSRGMTVLLRGGLGAGKTTLAKGIARGAGVRETVRSPTYTIIQEYEAETSDVSAADESVPFYHIDAYRLSGVDDFVDIGGEDIIRAGEGITVIEWSERIAALMPPDALTIDIEIQSDGRRKITVRGGD